MGRWEPIIDGALADRAWDVVDHVARALRDPPDPYDNQIVDDRLRASLFAREAGFAVFYAYLAKATNNVAHAELAADYLEQAVDRINEIATDRPYFAFGFSGTAWALEHVEPLLVGVTEGDSDGEPPGDEGDDDDGDALDMIDEALSEVVEAQDASAAFMLNTGFVGYGAYALERMPRPGARRLLAAVCDKLVAAAEPGEPGRRWRIRGQWMVSPDGEPTDAFHTGIKSGAAGPIAILGAAASWGVEPDGGRDAIEQGVAWLDAQRAGGQLPPAVGAGQSADGYALGAAASAAALWAATRSLGDASIDAILSAISADAAARPIDAGDPSMVTGIAGTGHALHRLAQATGDERFRDAAIRILEVLIEEHDPELALGGYQFFIPEWERRYLETIPTGHRDLPGISLGVAGIALALLAAIAPIEPGWDRMFLLSAREPSTSSGGASWPRRTRTTMEEPA